MNSKTVYVGTRITPEQKKTFEIMAEKAGKNAAEMMRELILSSINKDESLVQTPVEFDTATSKTYINLNKEQNKKITNMATKLGITKQQCIGRLINEGNIYDLNVNIDLEEEFLSLTSQVKALNNMISGIYSVVKKSDGVFTKREVDNMYRVMNEIRDSSNKILASVYKTCGQLTEMTIKRMDKLIKEKTGG